MTTTESTQTHFIELTHNVPVTRERVFRAFTEPEELMKWWGPPGFTSPSAEIDLRVGGSYRFEMQAPDGDRLFVKGIFKEIEPPSKLVMTWAWEHTTMDREETLVTIEFAEKGTSTEIRLRHEGFADVEVAERHNEGWVGCFSCLNESLAE